MEYVEGETLAAKLKRRPLGMAEALDLARQVAEALDVAHAAGVVHRDIKPSNLMVTRRNRVKVLDFGVAKILESTSEVQSDDPGAGGSGARPGTR